MALSRRAERAQRWGGRLGGALLALGLIFLGTYSQIWTVALVVGLAVIYIMVTWREPELGLLLLLVIDLQFIFYKAITDPYSHYGGASSLYVSTIDVLMILLYLYWMARLRFLEEAWQVVSSREGLLLLAPLVAGWLSLANVVQWDLSLFEMVRYFKGYLLFLYVACFLREPRQATYLVGALMVVLLTQSTIGLIQYFFQTPIYLFAFLSNVPIVDPRTYGGVLAFRVGGTILHPNVLAAFLTLLVALSTSLTISRRRWWARWVFGLLTVAGAMTVAVTFSRGGLVGMMLALAMVVMLHLWKRGVRLATLAIISGILAVGAAVGVYLFIEPLLARFAAEPESWLVRLQWYQVAWNMFAHNPLVGVGLNNWQEAVAQYINVPLLLPRDPAHSTYALTLGETGLVGMAALALVIWALYRIGLRAVRHPDGFLSAVGIGFVAGFIGFLINDLAEFNWRLDVTSDLLWIMAALALAIGRMRTGAASVGTG